MFVHELERWCRERKANIQFLETGTRPKNGVAIAFTHADGHREIVGGNTIGHCVQKADTLIGVRKSVEKKSASVQQ